MTTPRLRLRLRLRPALAAIAGAAVLAGAAPALGAPSASLELRDPDGGRDMGHSSTFTSGTFTLKNTGDAAITGLRIDLRTAALTDLVFDRADGTPAGDSVGRDVTVDAALSDVPQGALAVQYLTPQDDGDRVIDMSIAGMDPNDDLVFGVDVDPTSTRGGIGDQGDAVTPPAAHVSGAELHGATVTVRYVGGAEHISTISLTPQSLAAGNWERAARAAFPVTTGSPTITRANAWPSPSQVNASQTVQQIRVIGGAPGATGVIVVDEAHLNVAKVPNGGFDLDPFEANMAAGFREIPFTANAAGEAVVNVTLTATNPHKNFPAAADAPKHTGLNLITAHWVANGVPGPTSAPVTLWLVPNGPAEQAPPPGGAGGPATPIPPAVAPAPSPICATGVATATGSGGSGGRVTLTDRQLLINQRISQAAVRRLNAVQAWLDAGVAARDLCGGSIGADRLASGTALGVGTQVAGVSADPRAVVAKARTGRPGRVTVTLRQLRINDRIARAALQRAQAIERRLAAGLTGGDLRPGAVGSAQLAPGLVVIALPAAATSAARTRTVLTGSIDGPRVRFAASQMLVTQRVSQRAVRITNELTARLSRGLRGSDFRPRSIGSPQIDP